MIRIVLSTIFTIALCVFLRDLVPHGMWLQLGGSCIASFGFGALLMMSIYSKE